MAYLRCLGTLSDPRTACTQPSAEDVVGEVLLGDGAVPTWVSGTKTLRAYASHHELGSPDHHGVGRVKVGCEQQLAYCWVPSHRVGISSGGRCYAAHQVRAGDSSPSDMVRFSLQGGPADE